VLKFETGNPHSYKNLESPGSLERRLDAIRHLANTGWLVASGFISGLPGETPDDLALSMKTLLTLPLVGSSVSPLIPGEMTPLHGCPPGNLDTALNCVAIMRIASPSWIIPAVSAMAIEDRHGYARAFQAGANLATINLTPKRERTNFVIYKKDRRIMSLERVLAAMEEAGCEPCRIGISETLLSNLGE
jgi:biotin synthase